MITLSRVTLWNAGMCLLSLPSKSTLLNLEVKMFFLIASPENFEFSETLNLWSLSKDKEIVNDISEEHE